MTNFKTAEYCWLTPNRNIFQLRGCPGLAAHSSSGTEDCFGRSNYHFTYHSRGENEMRASSPVLTVHMNTAYKQFVTGTHRDLMKE